MTHEPGSPEGRIRSAIRDGGSTHFVDRQALDRGLGWLVNMGNYGPATVKALETVGAHQCSTIVGQILNFFPGGQPSNDDQERVRQIMAVEDVAEPHWSDLGDRLLAWPDDIHMLLQQFINEHEADFT